jgi:hypothetical protein
VRCSMSQMNVKNDTVVEEAQVSPASRRRLFAETEGGEATQQPSAAADEQLDAWERQARENTTEQASTRPHSRSHRPRSVRPSLLEMRWQRWLQLQMHRTAPKGEDLECVPPAHRMQVRRGQQPASSSSMEQTCALRHPEQNVESRPMRSRSRSGCTSKGENPMASIHQPHPLHRDLSAWSYASIASRGYRVVAISAVHSFELLTPRRSRDRRAAVAGCSARHQAHAEPRIEEPPPGAHEGEWEVSASRGRMSSRARKV